MVHNVSNQELFDLHYLTLTYTVKYHRHKNTEHKVEKDPNTESQRIGRLLIKSNIKQGQDPQGLDYTNICALTVILV